MLILIVIKKRCNGTLTGYKYVSAYQSLKLNYSTCDDSAIGFRLVNFADTN